MTQQEPNRISLDDLLVFHTVARSLASSLDLDAILRTILQHMERLIETGMWSLLMLDPVKNELYCAIAGSGHQENWRTVHIACDEGVAGWVMQHGQTLIVPENSDRSALPASDERMSVDPGRTKTRTKIRSVIAMPLNGRTKTHGVIEIINPNTDKLNDSTIAMLHILADYAAIAIENAQDVARIQQLTITDDTTGLYNIRHLYNIMERELATCDLLRRPLSFAFLDLDRFKQVNDRHGHLAGSDLLGHVGRRISALSRPGDFCFRYGGDEFAILMPHTRLTDAVDHIRQIHSALTATHFTLSNGAVLGVNASVGVAAFPEDGTTVHAVIGAADARMYRVKATGRGRVEGA